MTSWPELPYAAWSDTLDTVHMVLQILGKVRVALSPKEPEWAHLALYVSARGITTGPVPSSSGLFEVEADFVDHAVIVRTSAGEAVDVALRDRPIAEFWSEFVAALRAVGVNAELSDMPQEVAGSDPVPRRHDAHTYDAEAATRFWQVLATIEPVFEEYRAAFQRQGLACPVLLGECRPHRHAVLGSAVHATARGCRHARARDVRRRADERGVVAGERVVPGSRVLRLRVPEARGHRAGEAGVAGRVLERRSSASSSSCTRTSVPPRHRRPRCASSSTPRTTRARRPARLGRGTRGMGPSRRRL